MRPPVNGRTVSGTRRGREVLDAATRLFHSRGYADTSMRDLAEELGILKGSVYHYTYSKEDLLYRLLEEAHEEVQAILDEVLELEGLGPLERLREYVTRQVDYTAHHLAEMAIYYRDIDKLSDDRVKAMLRKRRVHEQFVVDCIEQARSQGEVAVSLDPRLTSNYLFGSMIWVHRWYRPNDDVKPADVAATCADFIIDGVTGGRVQPRSVTGSSNERTLPAV